MATEDASSFDPDDLARRVELLGRLVHRYAWCRVPSFWFYSDLPDYLLVIQLPDGRRYWRCLAASSRTPDEILLGWATCPLRKWMQQFRVSHKGSKLWHEYFNFWLPPATSRTNHPSSS